MLCQLKLIPPGCLWAPMQLRWYEVVQIRDISWLLALKLNKYLRNSFMSIFSFKLSTWDSICKVTVSLSHGARHLSNIPQARVRNLSCDIYQTYFRPGGFPQGAARLPVPGPGLHRHLQWLPQEGGIPLPRVAVHHSSSGERANICINFSFDKVSQRETKQWLGRFCWSSLS